MTVNTEIKKSKPIKLTAVRIENSIEEFDFYNVNRESVIKDYCYYPEKRIIVA